MNAGYALFTKWKTAKGFTSDNAAALALGVTRGTASNWKRGENAPSLEHIKHMAKDCGVDYEPFALAIEATRASTPELAALLAHVAKRLGQAAATLILAALPYSGHTTTIDKVYYDNLYTGSVYYVKFAQVVNTNPSQAFGFVTKRRSSRHSLI